MPHYTPLISTIVAGLVLAFVLAAIAQRLRISPLVGYLLAGVLLGPGVPGFFTADQALANELAEIGVILLMFGVGLHFSLKDLLSVRRIALPGAVVQIAVATALGVALAMWLGWPIGGGLVFGLALSVASTVVLLRALEERGILDSLNGRIAVGWLVVEDLVTVLVLVLLPAFAATLGGTAADSGAGAGLWRTLAVTLGQVAAFIGFMLLVGRRLFPWILWQVARTGSRELFTLCVIAAAVGIAYGSTRLFGVSFALGAFFAGMVLRESELSHRAAQESLPLRDAFAVLFFVSVGMLFEPAILLEQPLRLLAVCAIVIFGKSIAAFLLVLALRYPFKTALTVSASLAQIGEFSFILAALGISLGLMPPEGQSLILGGAIISITLNPLLFGTVKPLQRWLGETGFGRRIAHIARNFERPGDPLAELPMSVDQSKLSGQVVLVGYGRVGRRIGEILAERGVHFVVAEQNREIVDQLRKQGIAAVAGNAGEPAVLIQAHITHATMLVITTPDTFHVRAMIETARALNPGVQCVLRTDSDEEAGLLRGERAGQVFIGKHELAAGMARHVLETFESGEQSGSR